MLFVDFCEQFRFGWLIVFYKLCDLGTAGKAHEHDQTAEQRYEFGLHGVGLLLILILPFPIFLPDAVQAIGDEGLAIKNVRVAGFADGAGQIAGGVEFELRAEFGAEALSQSVQQAGGAQHEAVLQAGGGVLAQNGG